MTTNQDQPLKPASFTPATQAPTSTQNEPASRPRWLVPAGLGIVVAAIGVFVVLPALVNNPDTNADIATDTRSDVSAKSADTAGNGNSRSAADAAPERSPFAEAQLQQQRKTAQDALQRLLELQQTLTELEVQTWAATPYQGALELAKVGDAAYRERDFTAAASAYLDAATQLEQLEDSIPERADSARNDLLAAVERGDSEAASVAMSLLQQLDPRGSDIDALQQRIDAIPTVQAALESASDQADKERFNEAIALVEQALNADPAHKAAQVLLNSYRQSATDAAFHRAMSEGYLALEQGEFDQADARFRSAAALRPGAQEPQAAQVELVNARTADTLRQLQDKGASLEAEEQWAEALAIYQEAMALDATVRFAREGVARSEPRAALDSDVAALLDAPERLVDPRVLREAQDTLAQMKAEANPGPVLSEKIRALEDALSYAQTPVNVALVSDGLTDVTLLRVKRLGDFERTELTLRPGRYTALGVRTGYRDVRIDFEVAPGNRDPVIVRCTEAL